MVGSRCLKSELSYMLPEICLEVVICLLLFSFLIMNLAHALCSVSYKHFYSFVPADLCTLCRFPNA